MGNRNLIKNSSLGTHQRGQEVYEAELKRCTQQIELSLVTMLNKIKNLVSGSGKKETQLASALATTLGWSLKPKRFPGLFGFKFHASDRLARVGRCIFVLEVKKVRNKEEWGYWHALIQAEIYRFWLRRNSRHTPVVCVVFDWGRRAGHRLTNDDRVFCDGFKTRFIYTVRFSLKGMYFLEHNLGNGWAIVREKAKDF